MASSKQLVKPHVALQACDYLTELIKIAQKTPLRGTTVNQKADWFNRVEQKALQDFIPVKIDFTPRVHEKEFVWEAKYQIVAKSCTIDIAKSEASSKMLAKDQIIDFLIYDWQIHPVEIFETASAESSVAAPIGDETVTEKVLDTTVLKLSNIQTLDAEPPRPEDEFMELCRSVPNHDYPTMQEREHFHSRFTVSSIDTYGKVVFKLRVPLDLLRVEGSVGATPYLNHIFNATAIEILVKTNPAPNQAGLYIPTHIPVEELQSPLMIQNWLAPPLIVQRSGGLQNCINLGVQNDLRYVMPLNMPSSYVVSEESEDPLSDMRNSATFYMVTVSPLATGDSDVQTLEFMVLYRFLGAKLNSMRYTKENSEVLMTDGIRSEHPTVFETGNGVVSSLKPIVSGLHSIPIVGQISQLAGQVAGHAALALSDLITPSVSNKFRENLTDLGIISGDKNKGGGGAIIKEITRFSASRTPAQSEIKIMAAGVPCLANAGQEAPLHRLGLHCNIQNLADKEPITLSGLAELPNLMREITISTSTAPGTILLRLKMNLINAKELYRAMSGFSNHRYYGPLGFLASHMAFYSGKKIYEFTAVKTIFHKFSLAIAGSPYTDVPDSTEAGSQYWQVLDFQENNVHTYDCPYVDKYFTRPTANCSISTNPSAGFPNVRSLPVPFVGELAVILVTPLTITGNSSTPMCSSTITVQITERLAPGAQFSCPTEAGATMVDHLQDFPLPPSGSAMTEPYANVEETAGTESNFGALPAIGTLVHNSDSHDNLYTLINRYTAPKQYTLDGILSFPMHPRAFRTFQSSTYYPAGTEFIPTWSWPAISAFLYWRGSVDFIITTEKRQTMPPIFVTYEPNKGQAALGRDSERRLTGEGLPFYLNGNFTTMLDPNVNPSLAVSTSMYVKSKKVLLHPKQNMRVDDVRASSGGTILLFTPRGEFDPPRIWVWPKYSADTTLDTFMGFLPMRLQHQEMQPVVRVLDTDGHTSRLDVLKLSDIRRIGESDNAAIKYVCGSTEVLRKRILKRTRPEAIHIRSHSRESLPQHAPLPDSDTEDDDRPYDYASYIAHTPSVFRATREMDRRRQLMLSGDIETNPGPSWSSMLQPLSDFRSTVSSSVMNTTKELFPIGDIRDDIKRAADKLDISADKVVAMSEKISTLSDSATGLTQSLNEKVAELYDSITQYLGKVPDKASLWQALLHLVHVISNPKPKTIGISIVGVISALNLMPDSMYSKGCEMFGAIANWWSGAPEVNSAPGVHETAGGDNEDALANIGAFIFSAVAIMCGFKMTSNNYPGWIKGAFLQFPKIWSTTTHIARFLNAVIGLFRRAFAWICEKMAGKGVAYLHSNEKFIKQFVEDAQEFTNPINATALKNQPGYKTKFWITVMNGYYLEQMAAKHPQIKFPPTLIFLIKQVKTLANELAMFHKCCPVRYEPFVFGLVGDSNIGKSYIVEDIGIEMLKSINHTSYGHPVYVRPPGNAYWPGCNDQPIVLYDDFGAVMDQTIWLQQLSELFALKTTVPFMPNMASLNEKEIRYNPKIVALTSNEAYPNLNSVRNPKAVYRRRDLLVNVRKVHQYKDKNTRDIPREVLEKYGHLEFGIYATPGEKCTPHGFMNYETFKTYITTTFKKYNTQECQNVKSRMSKLQELLPEAAAKIPDGADPFELFYGAQLESAQKSPSQSGLLPSQTLHELLENSPQLDTLSRQALSYMRRISTLPKNTKEQGSKIKVNDKEVNGHYLGSEPTEVPEQVVTPNAPRNGPETRTVTVNAAEPNTSLNFPPPPAPQRNPQRVAKERKAQGVQPPKKVQKKSSEVIKTTAEIHETAGKDHGPACICYECQTPASSVLGSAPSTSAQPDPTEIPLDQFFQNPLDEPPQDDTLPDDDSDLVCDCDDPNCQHSVNYQQDEIVVADAEEQPAEPEPVVEEPNPLDEPPQNLPEPIILPENENNVGPPLIPDAAYFNSFLAGLEDQVTWERRRELRKNTCKFGPIALIAGVVTKFNCWFFPKINKMWRQFFKFSNFMLRGKCIVCHEFKSCDFRCSNPCQSIHLYCSDCKERLPTNDCALNCGHKIVPYTIGRNYKASHFVAMLACAVQQGYVALWNFLVEYATAFDIMILMFMPILSVQFAEDFSTREYMERLVDSYNQDEGTDYYVQKVVSNGVVHYYAVSREDVRDWYYLSGDPEPGDQTPKLNTIQNIQTDEVTPFDEPDTHQRSDASVSVDACVCKQGAASEPCTCEPEEQFQDAMSDILTPAPTYKFPVDLYINYKNEGTLEQHKVQIHNDSVEDALYARPSCPHRKIKPHWKYLNSVLTGRHWMPPLEDAECPVPDDICHPDTPGGCRWTKAARVNFLIEWTRHNYHDLADVEARPINFEATKSRPRKLWDKLNEWWVHFKSKPFWCWLGDKIREYGKIIAFATTVITFVGATLGLVFYFKSPNTDVAPQGGYTAGATINVASPSQPVPTTVTLTGNAQQAIPINAWAKNHCWLQVYDPQKNETFISKCTAIRDRWIIITRHQFKLSLDLERKGQQVSLIQARELNKVIPIKLEGLKTSKYEGYDLMGFQCRRTEVSCFKSILQFVQDKKEIVATKRNAKVYSYWNSQGIAYLTMADVVVDCVSATAKVNAFEGGSYTVNGVISYTGFSGPNTCGSLLMFEDNNKPLAGFHFSAETKTTTGQGFAVPLTREVLEQMTPCDVQDVQDVYETAAATVEPVNVKRIQLDGFYEHVGYIDKKKVPYQQTESKIIKSTISDALVAKGYPRKTEPAILTPRDPRWKHGISPYISGVNKHCVRSQNFPPKLVNAVINAARVDFLATPPVTVDVKVRSYAESVCGLQGLKEFPPIPMDTSVGFPLNTDPQKWTRTSILNPIRNAQEEMIDIKMAPEFESICNANMSLRSNGVVPCTIFWDHLKDERRKPEKARALGGTRIFSLSPLEFLLSYRRYYMDFHAAWHAGWKRLEHAVGIDADGPSWSVLVTKLLSKSSKNFICLDYSNFGPGLNTEIAARLMHVITEWYDKYADTSDDVVRRVMAEEICSPLHLCDGLIYRTLSGIPSGHPGTTLLNTEVNKAYIKMAYLSLVPKELKNLSSFKNHVALFCYGDDLVMSVTDDVAPYFNGKTIQQFFSRYGIVVTPADKGAEMQEFTPFEEISFLKRRILPHPERLGMWLAPLEVDSVHECPHWIIKNENPALATQVNADQGLRLGYGHGPDFFKKWKDDLNEVLTNNKALEPLYLLWDDLDENFFD